MHAYHFDKDLNELAEYALMLHKNERGLSMQSIHVVGELEQRRASFALGMSDEKFAKFIGLTINKYRTRLKAWRTISFFPRAQELFEQGEIDVCHLSMITGKITQANEDALLEGLRGTSTREAAAFIRRVDNNGIILDALATTEFTCRFVGDECKELERAREILAHSGHVPSNSEIIVAALREFVHRRDPMKKAERAAARSEKKKTEPRENSLSRAEDNDIEKVPVNANENSINHNENKDRKRKPIPVAVRREVWLRDGGQCTYNHADGSRCEARMMLELDHIVMVCRNGQNDSDNIRLRCRFHNQRQAEVELGRPLF